MGTNTSVLNMFTPFRTRSRGPLAPFFLFSVFFRHSLYTHIPILSKPKEEKKIFFLYIKKSNSNEFSNIVSRSTTTIYVCMYILDMQNYM